MEAVQSVSTKSGTTYTSRLQGDTTPIPRDRDTLPKNFLLRVKEFGDRVAMRKKRYGIWQEYSWNEVYEHTRDFCLGLVSLGLRQGETIAIIGDNDPQFYWAQIAVHSARGM